MADGVNAALARLLREHSAAEVAEALLRATASSAQSWQRHRVLENLRLVDAPHPLIGALAAALGDDADAERRNAARSALATLARPGWPAAEPTRALLEERAVGDADSDVRLLAVTALGESGNRNALPVLLRALADPEPNVTSAAADALAVLGDAGAVNGLARASLEGPLWSRLSAVVALGQLRDARAIPALADAAAEPLLVAAAMHSLGEIADPAGLDAIRRVLDAGTPDDAHAAQHAAALIVSAHPNLPPPGWLRSRVRGTEPELEAALRNGDPDQSARLLGIAGSARAAEILLDAVEDPDLRAAATVGMALLPSETLAALLTQPLGPAQQAAILLAMPPLADAAATQTVAEFLGNPDAEIRVAAVAALARSAPDVAVPTLLGAMTQPGARSAAADALSRFCEAPEQPLVSLLTDPDARLRTAGAEGLTRCATPSATAAIRQALGREHDPLVRRALIRALGAAGGDAAVAELAPLLQDPDTGIRFATARALGATRASAALAPLIEALGDPDVGVQAAVLRSLGLMRDPGAALPVGEWLRSANPDLRRTAARSLETVASAEVVEPLTRALDDPSWEIRVSAVRALGRIGAHDLVERLREIARDDPDRLVREAADQAVQDVNAG